MSEQNAQPYTESSVIMTTIRVVSPFAFTYGLFVMFHGADSPGGGFQGGAIVAAMVLMLAFAFGIDPTRRWFKNVAIVLLATGGALAFLVIGIVPLLLGGSFLEYSVYGFESAAKYGIEGVELGIGAIVASVISGLFFAIASEFEYTEGRR